MNDPRSQNNMEYTEYEIQSNNPSVLYQQGMECINKNDYSKAAEIFESIGQFSDAPKLVIYSKAAVAGEKNDFDTACNTFKLLGNFFDSSQMISYYQAREIESKGIEYYIQAIKAYTDIVEIRDSSTRILNCQKALYNKASSLWEEEKYEEAANVFEALDDYSDSYFMKVYCDALKAESEEDYIIASDLFKSIIVFKDSSDHANECKKKQLDKEERFKGGQYDLAVEALKASHYCDAYKIFTTIVDYKDVVSILKGPTFEVLSKMHNLSRIYLGLYPQVHPKHPDAIYNWSDYGYNDNYIIKEVKNGIVEIRPIEWIVKGRIKNTITLISKNGLDAMAYDRNGNQSWEESSIRFWLNSYFFDKAFNAFEKELLSAQDSSCIDEKRELQDRVTLLNKNDMVTMFANKNERLCSPTMYAVANESSGNIQWGRLICWWWLREPGKYVTIDGDVDNSDVRDSRGTVRPVITVNVDKLVEDIVNKKIELKEIIGS